jgi:glycosyltransferase involved in cell wall biosynthesis
MRILYLTGHYPPDLTSGATLLVQRLAHAARRAGHDVRVVAGAYRAGLADGAVSDSDDDGVPVRWIGTTGWTDQDVDANWWNPAAATVVAGVLDDWRPDVVHAHALQTLGGGVLEEAARRGIRTVVTMHDLWWWCARLFLVDTTLQPCSLVTCLGECPCARTTEWREHRSSRLLEVLARVDLVLTPSSALRDVVVANGLDPARVRVDPNDVEIGRRADPLDPDAVLSAPDVRFVYLGGPNPLKGADVIAAAARHLTGTNGWRLVAHGLIAPVSPLPERATVRPPFDPSERDAVLASADVLVLPSVARESYSLAAREALAAGLAVITSDCLGPEEVVIDGVNGLVVPTGDARALAAAMTALVHDREMLVRLREGASSTTIPDLDADMHLAGLLTAYAGPAGHAVSAPAVPPPSTLVIVDADGDLTRWRGHQTVEALREVGGRAEVVHVSHPDLTTLVADHDVALLVRVGLSTGSVAALQAARDNGTTVVFDADDLADLRGDVLAFCDGVIAATDHGARALGETFEIPAMWVPPHVGIAEGRLADRARRRERRPGPLRVGVLGVDDPDLAAWTSIEPTVAATLAARADTELHLVGVLPASDLTRSLGRRLVHHDTPTWTQRPDLLRDLDVVLAPVTPGDNPANHHDVHVARTWISAALVRCATIASDNGTLRLLATPGRDVMTASTPDEWRLALEHLLDDALARARLANQAERAATLRHGPALHGRRVAQALDAIRSAPRPVRPVPVDDTTGPEWTEPVVLEPYDVPPPPAGSRTRGRWRALIGRLR